MNKINKILLIIILIGSIFFSGTSFASENTAQAEESEKTALSQAKTTIEKNIKENAKLKEELEYKGYGPGDSSYDTAVSIQGELENTLSRINEGKATSEEAAEAISDFNKESAEYKKTTPRAMISQDDATALKSGEPEIAETIMDNANKQKETLQGDIDKTQEKIDKATSTLSTLEETAATDTAKLKELEASGIASSAEINAARAKAEASKNAFESQQEGLKKQINTLEEQNSTAKEKLSMVEQRIDVTENTIKKEAPVAWEEMKNSQAEAQAESDAALAQAKQANHIESLKQQIENANDNEKAKLQQELENLQNEIQKAFDKACEDSGDCLTESSFMLDTTTTFGLGETGGEESSGGGAQNSANSLLGNIIQKLMIMLGSVSLLIMTVGAGYMILFHGQDEYLSKGKGIFVAGITSLVIALSSYMLVSLLRFILYSSTGSGQ